MPVVVMAAAHGERQAWATVTLMYVSFVPPQVCVALLPDSRSLELARASTELSLSLLGADQVEISMQAGRRVPGGSKGVPASLAVPAPDGSGFSVPGVGGALATLWCHVAQEIPTADHVLVIATVVAQVGPPDAAGADGAPPLLRFQRRYHALGAALSEPSPEGYPI